MKQAEAAILGERLPSHGAGLGALMAQESVLESVNARISRHECLSKLVVTADSWEIAEGLLTPTMKIKRSAREARYDARARALGSGVVVL